MKKSQTNFNSGPGVSGAHLKGAPVTDRLSTAEDSFAGISYLPKGTIERLDKQRKMSPRSIKRKVNYFVEEKVLKNPETTSVVFEELSANTGKIHRQALHSKLDSVEGANPRLRGQTAGVGIRLNPKLAAARGGLASQSIMQRARGFHSQVKNHQIEEPATTAGSLSKSGFTYYPGQPLKVSTESVLGQTLDKFELGVTDKNKLKQISGTEYYKQHIHTQQQRRLKKYIKDAAGHAPKSKGYVLLSDVAKPSMQGRVKMYMQRLTEEENREKNRQMKAAAAAGKKQETFEPGQKSASMLGSFEGGPTSPGREDAFFSQRKGRPQTLEPLGQNKDSVIASGYESNNRRKQVLSTPGAGDDYGMSGRHRQQRMSSMHSRGPIGVNTSTKSVAPSQATPGTRKERGKSVTHPSASKQIAAVEEEDEQYRDDAGSWITTPLKGGARKGSQKKIKISESNEGQANLGKSTKFKNAGKSGDLSVKHTIKTDKTASAEVRKHLQKKGTTPGDIASMSDEQKMSYLYRELSKFQIFQPQEQSHQQIAASQQAFNLMPDVVATYKAIYASGQSAADKASQAESGEKGEPKAGRYQNMKIHKKNVLTYLRRRYTSRLATKLASIFDWSNSQLEYKDFYMTIKELLVEPKEISKEVYATEHIRLLKKFAFQMLDMNCDNMLCETDLFSYLELHGEREKNDYFRQVLIYDMQDITKAFNQRNTYLTVSDQVMDHGDPREPRIKNLPAYLELTQEQLEQRKKAHEQDVYISSLLQTPSIDVVGGKSSGEPSIDPSDFYSMYGPGYKSTFNKMMGAAKKTQKVVIQKDQVETSKTTKRDQFELQLREMRHQGAQQFAAEHKKKPLMSFFIHRTNEFYDARNAKAFLTEEEFLDRIQFKFGIPLVVLDFIDYLCGSKLIEQVKQFVNPKMPIERFKADNSDFQELKSKVDEEFLPYIFQLFNALGEETTMSRRNVPQEERESTQYLTLNSLKTKLPDVFGIKNDFLATMLFSYISEHSPLTHKLNFEQFFRRFEVFWPKKEAIPEMESHADKESRERNARQARKALMRKFMFDFVRVSGGKQLSILDLVKLCCYFKEDSCDFGEECERMMAKYKQLNIEPKYVHTRTEFGFQQYLKIVPYSCLIADLEFAFVGQIRNKINAIDTMSEEKRPEEGQFVSEFPMHNGWKMRSVFDERQVADPKRYQEELARRRGIAADLEVQQRLDAGKPVIERKIDRGYDIERTWAIKNFLNAD